MRFKLSTIIVTFFVLTMLLFVAAISLQYHSSKEMIVQNYKSKYYAESLHTRENFRLILDKLQYDFRKAELKNINKLHQLSDIYTIKESEFDVDIAAEILNEDVTYGRYEVILINKKFIVEKSSFKNDLGFDLGTVRDVRSILKSIFNKKIAIDISAPKLESSSMNMKRYLIKLSDDEQYILQLAFVLDYYQILQDAYKQTKIHTKADLNIFIADEYFLKELNFKPEKLEKKALEEIWESTKLLLTTLNKHLKNEVIVKILKQDSTQENINLNKELTKIFANKDSLLEFINYDENKICYYSITDGLFNQKNEVKLLIYSVFSLDDMKNDIEDNFSTFLVSVALVILISILVYWFVWHNTSIVLSIIKKMKRNESPDQSYIIVEELEELRSSYSKLHNDLNEQILVNKNLTYIDHLTQVKNRRAYNDKIGELFLNYSRYKTPFSIALLDIDNFKYINDTYGHTMGDKVLYELCRLIEPFIRKNDFLYRVGGEEFVLLLPQSTSKNALAVVEKIRKNIAKNLNIIDAETITISIGLTDIQQGDTEDLIYKRVDMLMYESKNSGKNKTTIK